MALPFRFLDDADAELAAFITWNGLPPAKITKQLHVQTRSGIDNAGLLELGHWNKPQQVQTKAIAASFNDACDLAETLNDLVGTLVKIEFAGRNWATQYDTWHDLVSLEVTKIGMEARIYSTKYNVNLAPAGIVICNWTILPRYVEPV